MSRREDRHSHSKRQYSRFRRDPSPKRSWREVKPEIVRQPAGSVMGKDYLDRGWKDCLRLNNASPLEASLFKEDPKVETGAVNKESRNKTDGHYEGTKHSSDQTKVARYQSYFQNVGHGDARQVGRSFSRRASTERGWWRDAKEQLNDRIKSKRVDSAAQLKDLNTKDNRKGNHTGKHDEYFRIEADPKVHARKRPSFSDQKLPSESKKNHIAATGTVIPNPEDHPVESEKREYRGLISRDIARREQTFVEEREGNRGKAWRGNFSSREKYGASGKHGITDSVIPRQGHRHVEKWKHDLHNEANWSPTPKNEEDQIAKIEALLDS